MTTAEDESSKGQHKDEPDLRAKRQRESRAGEPVPGAVLPTFLIIGAVKAGTTSLYHYLNQHPQVFMSVPKELHFFVEEWNWPLGWNWYQPHFQEGRGAIAVGEASVTYTQYPTFKGVPERIARYLPGASLVYVIRDPVERIRSEYVHRVLIGKEREPLDRAVLENPRYVNHSRYATQIEQYLAHFPADQLLIITSERLRRAREDTVKRVARFVGIDPEWTWPSLGNEFYRTDERREFGPFLNRIRSIPGVHQLARLIPLGIKEAAMRPAHKFISPERTVMSERVQRELRRRLTEDVRRLRNYLGDEFDGWGVA